MTFINENFMLQTDYAKTLYKYVENEPIFDYHCHLEAKEIYENKQFKNITEIWLGGDHYKWRVMRACGVDEKYITGDSTDFEKFQAWAKTVPQLIGNPLYHWTHLELKRFFGIDEILSPETCESIWNKCNELLATEEFKAQELIKKSNVWAVCTTNDPIDNLIYHSKIKELDNFNTLVLPAFRPDKILNIENKNFNDYLCEIEETIDYELNSIESIKKYIKERIKYFHERGCRACDHALNYVPYVKANKQDLDLILEKKLNNESLTKEEQDAYKTNILIFLAEQYNAYNWVMEYHIGALRDNSRELFNKLGPDVGNDAVNDFNFAENLANLFSDIQEIGMPRTILFTLNPKDYYVLATIAGSFQGGEEGIARIQLGTSWWFLDHKNGMIEQMQIFSQTGVFAKFIGMLTDSRSFLSYPRHEYFRRIMCNFIGDIVENGEYPWNEEFLGEMVKNISFKNAKEYIQL